jgi:hypothetical protein
MSALFASNADTDNAHFSHEHRVPATAAFDVHLASAAAVPVAASTAAALEPRQHVVIIGGDDQIGDDRGPVDRKADRLVRGIGMPHQDDGSPLGGGGFDRRRGQLEAPRAATY